MASPSRIAPGWPALYLTLTAALLLRLPGIEWGLPPAVPEVRASGIRASHAFDEDDALSGVAKASVRRLDFDPREYRWGTLHLEAVLLALDGAEALGAFHATWRSAYYNLLESDFVRVYVVARLVAVAAALGTIWLLSMNARKTECGASSSLPDPAVRAAPFALFRNSRKTERGASSSLPDPAVRAAPFALFRNAFGFAGVFAAMLVAVSPSHVMLSDQVRADVTMTALLTATLLAAMRAISDPQPRRLLILGLAGGLAIASKYSAATAVLALCLATFAIARFPRLRLIALALGLALGFVAGCPYIVVKPGEFYRQVHFFAVATANIPAEYAIPTGHLLAAHAVNTARFSTGPIAFLLAIAGLWRMLRRRSPDDWLILAAIAGYVAVLPVLRWPMLRYSLPLVVLLGLCAGIALEALPGLWRWAAAAAALAMPLAGALAQLHYMREPNPANVILPRILQAVPPGTAIARLYRESPPLDDKVYPFRASPPAEDLTRDPPSWILHSDLPDAPYRESTLALLRSEYETVAHAETRRVLTWATLGEQDAPHDWKYTHATYTLYRKKSP